MEARRLQAILSAARGRPLADSELSKFSGYLDLIWRWNRVHSLTALSTEQAIAEGLLADSLLFLDVLPTDAVRLMDLGSGPGIPGIPIKIVSPEMELVLVEARRKKASFLSTAVRELSLEQTRVVGYRAEQLLDLEPAMSGAFDVVVARAAGRPAEVRDLSFSFLRPGGMLLLGGNQSRASRAGTEGFEVVRVERGKAEGRTVLIARKPVA
jgi:16S rRNA (guanine527-N7)-methyltransferase